MKKNIFIEGMQGTGKSTLVSMFQQKYPDYKAYREGDISPVELAWCSYMDKEAFETALSKYEKFREDIQAKTVQEGECYITAYTQILTDCADFYKYMEDFEIYNGRVSFQTFHDIIMKRYRNFAENGSESGNIFECSFFQNSIESMMLFYELEEEQIIRFYREAYEILKEKQFCLVYLDSETIKENIEIIKKERTDENGNEIWFEIMLKYLQESPYGKKHGFAGIDDMVAHFERRRNLERKIIREVVKENATVLEAKNYDFEKLGI